MLQGMQPGTHQMPPATHDSNYSWDSTNIVVFTLFQGMQKISFDPPLLFEKISIGYFIFNFDKNE